MRTTLNLDDALLDEARRITGIHEKTALARLGRPRREVPEAQFSPPTARRPSSATYQWLKSSYFR